VVLARIEFKSGRGVYFCPGLKQDVIEMIFESPEALVETLRELEQDIFNCTAQIGGRILDLRNISGINAPF
jgi:hypothetical protein